MNTIAKLAVPAAFAMAAFGVQGQTLETDYPLVSGAGSVAVVAKTPAGAAVAPFQAAPYLVQSNFEGPTANPALIKASTLSRDDVRAQASVRVQWTPADQRS